MNLSNRVKTLTPSSTLAISAMATELKAQGHDVIGLGVGEPDFNTPPYVIRAAKQAMDEGMTKYTATGGVMKLKQAIINKFERDNDLSYSPDEIIVTSRSEEHTSELQSRGHLVCRLLLEKKNNPCTY